MAQKNISAFYFFMPTKHPRNGIWTLSLKIITVVTKPYATMATANRFSCNPPLRKLALLIIVCIAVCFDMKSC